MVPVGLHQSFYHFRYATNITDEESYGLKESSDHVTLLKNCPSTSPHHVPAQNGEATSSSPVTVVNGPCAEGKGVAIPTHVHNEGCFKPYAFVSKISKSPF